MPESLSVLSHPLALATKRKYLGPEGQILTEEYGKGAWFECITVPVQDLPSLANILEQLLTEPNAFVIRGEPIPGRDLERIRRAKSPKKGDPAGFRETPRSWLMVDADQALTREDVADLDLSKPEDCETGIKRLIARMPPELQKAGCFWQLSSSAGFKPGLRAHIWYWLDRPMGERELLRWTENVNDLAGRQLIDWHCHLTVQPLYTANPIIDVGVVDPIGKRSGILPGAPCLSLPRTTERTTDYLRKLAKLRDPHTKDIHAHLLSACNSYFRARGADAPDDDLRRAVRSTIAVAHALQNRDDYTDEKVDEHIKDAREWVRNNGTAAENLACNNDGTLKATLENARAIITSTPEWDGVLARNLRADKIVCRLAPPFEQGYAGQPESCPRPWRDTDDRRLVTWLARSQRQLSIPTHVVREAVDVIAAENAFDPVVDYLNSVQWDGEARLDEWLIDLCGVEDSRYTRKVASMWMIGAVARALHAGSKVDAVLVLEGPQGRKKSSFLRELAGGLDYFREGIGDIHQKDTLLAMQSAWIIELREMAGLSHKEIEAVKTFLDRQNDHYRAPYASRPEDHPRRCVMAATTNLQAYLRDDTGARRWWPVSITTCDLDGLAEVRDQLWAEAVSRYRNGEPWWVEAEDPDFEAEQEARFDVDSREAMLRDALEKGCAQEKFALREHPVPPIPPKAERVTVAQVLYHHWMMPTRDHDKKSQMMISSMLKRLGWIRQHSNDTRFWARGGHGGTVGGTSQ